MRIRCSSIGAAALAALLVLMPAPARAQTPWDSPGVNAPDILPDPPAEPPDAETDRHAREIYRQGDRLYAQGKYEHALEAFAQSYRMSGRPRILVAMANAYERLGRYRTAARALERYAPDAHADEAGGVRARTNQLHHAGRTAPAKQPAQGGLSARRRPGLEGGAHAPQRRGRVGATRAWTARWLAG